MSLSFLSLIVNSLLAARFCPSSHTLVLTMREERDGEILTGARGYGEEEAAFPTISGHLCECLQIYFDPQIPFAHNFCPNRLIPKFL
jgi:hypothetical protein